jgi:hypothetical protein
MRQSSSLRISKHSTHLIIILCGLFLATTALAQQPKTKLVHATSDHPLWRIDLQAQGYPANSPELQRRRGFEVFDTISFINESVLAATFVTRENIPDLQRRDDPNHTRPYRLHAVFLDALTGNTLHTLDWPIEDPNAGLFPRHDGGFLLITSEKIVSYSADRIQLKEVPFSDLHPATATIGGIAESPSAKSLVIEFLTGNTALCLNISTDNLDSTSIACGAFEVFSASDNGVVTPEKLPGGRELRENKPGGAYVEYGVAMPDAPPSAAVDGTPNPGQARSVRTFCNPCPGMPQFINNDVMAVYSPTTLKVVDRTGKVRFAQDYNSRDKWIDEFGRPLRASLNGQRFAVASNRSPIGHQDSKPRINENGNGIDVTLTGYDATVVSSNSQSRFAYISPLAIHMMTGDLPAEFPFDVEIYDVPSAQWIYTLQINSDHLHQIWGLTLSPSAEKLAIDSGGTIQVFSLPPAAKTPE